MQISITESDPQGVDALHLLRLAALEARELYPDLHQPTAPWPTNPPTPTRGAYFIAYVAGQAVGMGAHHPIDAYTTEVRRMFVMKAFRCKGVARAILDTIEHHAQAQGFNRLLLETGNRQHPAMKLYEACGYQRTAPFGNYKDDPISICYEKPITHAAANQDRPRM